MLSKDENWTITSDKIFKNIDDYSILLSNNSKGIEYLNNQYYKNLLISLTKPNYFELETREDIEKYFDRDGKRTKILLNILQGNIDDIPEKLKQKYNGDVEQLKKFAISEYWIGMNPDEATTFAKRYKGIENIEVDELDKNKKRDFESIIEQTLAISQATPKEG